MRPPPRRSLPSLGLALLAACGSPDAPGDGGRVLSDAAPIDAAHRDGGMHDASRRDAALDDGGSPDAALSVDAGHIDAAPLSDAGIVDASLRDGARPPLEILRTDLCEVISRLDCTAPWDCACPDRADRPDELECIDASADRCEATLTADLGEDLAAGTLVLDERSLALCRDRAIASFGTCSASATDLMRWCAIQWVDAAPLGSPCVSGRSAFCAGGTGLCTDTSCIPLPGADGPCAELPFCASGLVCADGATCTAERSTGELCENDSDCAAMLFCVAGTCRGAFVGLGGACDDTRECVAGARCLEGTCLAATLAAGETCETAADCPSAATCETGSARCARIAIVGETCGAPDGCAPDAFCDAISGTCLLRPAVGEDCTQACAPGAFCGAAGECASLGTEGSRCVAGIGHPSGCIEGLACVAGICATPPSEGAACADEGACAAGLECIVLDALGATRCELPRGGGERCDDGRDGNPCEPGLMCDPDTRVCAPRRTFGDPCEGDRCAEGLSCLYDPRRGGSFCGEIPSLGDRCAGRCTEGLACSTVPQCVPQVCDHVPAL
jgi:hypothetical protein